MELQNSSLTEFAEMLAAKKPVPGGGGASALIGALGAALAGMVGNYTVGKQKYADVEADVQAILAEASELQTKLLGLIDADAAAFEPLSRAYAMPADDPQRAEIMEACLRDAAAVPMEILRLSCRAIELHEFLEQKGSRLMQSDVGTGVIFGWAALYGAAINVKVNTKSMTDRAYAEAMNAEVDALVGKYWQIAEAVYEKTYKEFC